MTIIGIDIDGVIRDAVEGVRQAASLRYPTENIPPKGDLDTWYWADAYPFIKDFNKFVYEDAVDDIFWHYPPPMTGALEGVKALQKMDHVEVRLITSQRGSSIDATFHWLADYKVRPDGIIHANSGQKADAQYHILLEDRPQTLERCHKRGRRVV